MNSIAYVALYGALPATLLLFVFMPARQAAFTALVFGFLFLPQARVSIPGFIDLTKYTLGGVGLSLSIAPVRLGAVRRLSVSLAGLPDRGLLPRPAREFDLQ